MGVLIRLTLLAALVGAAGALRAAAPAEDELRAAMVYKLLLFVDWPAGVLRDGDTLLLCVVSEDADAARGFAALGERTVKGRALMVQRRGPLADLAPCHAVYFDRLEAGLLADKLARLAGRPVLTLATSTAAEAGAMIGLGFSDQRLAFDVRQSALRAAGVALDARVLRLAREVYR